MANPNPPPPPPEHRFTRENAAFYGPRGAAERERRFLEPFKRLEEIERDQMRGFRAARAVFNVVLGRPGRPRKRIAPWMDDHTIEMLNAAMDTYWEILQLPPRRRRGS